MKQSWPSCVCACVLDYLPARQKDSKETKILQQKGGTSAGMEEIMQS